MGDLRNAGHGHVYPRLDGVRARCGGPAICAKCALDAARKRAFAQALAMCDDPARPLSHEAVAAMEAG